MDWSWVGSEEAVEAVEGIAGDTAGNIAAAHKTDMQVVKLEGKLDKVGIAGQHFEFFVR